MLPELLPIYGSSYPSTGVFALLPARLPITAKLSNHSVFSTECESGVRRGVPSLEGVCDAGKNRSYFGKSLSKPPQHERFWIKGFFWTAAGTRGDSALR